MSAYIVSARKYRPTSFDNVVGQSALTTTLKNAIATGKLAHAYLFCGPRGVGKTTSARIFAKTINCLTPTPEGAACEQCESCRAFNEQRSYNIHELDAASNNSVDDIRNLIEQVQIPPQVGRYKVFIIDEVHMLSQAGFNAFLKTLEEPPAHAIFILATTEKHKILPTILSRCQIYDFARMEVPDVVRHLQFVAEKEGFTAEESALHVIAQKADGGMRDALSIFDQVAAYTGGNITYDKVIENLNVLDYDAYFAMTDHLRAVEIPEALLLLNKILTKGFEAQHFISGLAAHFRDLLVARDPQTLPLLEVAQNVQQRYQQQAQACTPQFLYAALKLCNQCDINYRTAPNKRLLVELTLIQVAQTMQAEEGPASGLGPTRRLLPIFSPVAAPQPSPAAATAPRPQATTASPAMPTATTVPPTAPPTSTPRPTGAMPMNDLLRSKLTTVSLKGLREQAKQAAELPVSQPEVPMSERRNQPFDIDRFAYACTRFANELPHEHNAESGRLKAIATEPTRFRFSPAAPDGTLPIEILVDNQVAADLLNQLLPQLTPFVANELRNDFIQVHFGVDETKVVQRRAYSPREIFQQMKEKSPAVAKLAEALHLEIL